MKKEIILTKKNLKSLLGTCKAFRDVCEVFQEFEDLPFPEIDLISEHEAKLILKDIYNIILKYKEDFCL